MAVTYEEVETKQAAQQAPTLANKHLISDQLWTRLTNRIVKDEKVELEVAERIMDQALGFLLLCAIKTSNQPYSPSEMVDIGWHTFILYTREYAQFCDQIAGHFIHHSPSDEEGVNYGTDNIAHTVEAMKAAGIQVDEELWFGVGSCSNYCRNSCSGSKCTDTGYKP